jgi:two-component system chemotaxis response regulator CheB
MPKLRVLVVDDAVVMRRIVGTVLEEDPQIEVAGIAANGKLALAKIPQCNPDAVTMDIEMPEMDGLQAMAEIHRLYPRLPVIMFSTLTQRGAVQTIEALSRGAVDYVSKPANVGSVSEAMNRLREELIPKLKMHCGRTAPVRTPVGAVPDLASKSSIAAVPRTAHLAFHCGVIAIGTSTGGPHALNVVIPALPADLNVPVVVVQHMPPVFTGLLAVRLNEISRVRVYEAEDGQPIQKGMVYIAPGGKHLEVAGSAAAPVARLHEGPPENSCRPAVDVLFRSVVNIYGGSTLAVIMTGMGHDGLRGSQAVREADGRILVQDKSSSVVWGMPGSVAGAGLADSIVPLDQMSASILANWRGAR